ncbi:hypothetical protein P3X46_022113, partial [Hevea brasiliensis]
KGVYKPCGKTLDLALAHTMHLAHTLSTSLFIFSQYKCSFNTSKVLATPK